VLSDIRSAGKKRGVRQVDRPVGLREVEEKTAGIFKPHSSLAKVIQAISMFPP
jgi:hypothetical protein